MSLIREGWLRWWFASPDPRVLALLRIGYGLLGLWTVFVLWPDRHALLGDPGVFPLEARDYNWTRPSVFALGLDPTPLLLAFVASSAALVAGAFSRVAMLVSWVFVVSVAHRNGLWTDGSDTILRVFGLYMLFLPLGRTWSVDSLWRPGTSPISGWPLRLFQLNVCILYVKTGLIKAVHNNWQSGDAVFYALASPTYWRFPMDGLLRVEAFQHLTTAMTWGTLVFEIGFPLVFLSRLRRPWLLVGLGLHLGIFAFMDLGAFSECILWTYLAFLRFGESRLK